MPWVSGLPAWGFPVKNENTENLGKAHRNKDGDFRAWQEGLAGEPVLGDVSLLDVAHRLPAL